MPYILYCNLVHLSWDGETNHNVFHECSFSIWTTTTCRRLTRCGSCSSWTRSNTSSASPGSSVKREATPSSLALGEPANSHSRGFPLFQQIYSACLSVGQSAFRSNCMQSYEISLCPIVGPSGFAICNRQISLEQERSASVLPHVICCFISLFSFLAFTDCLRICAATNVFKLNCHVVTIITLSTWTWRNCMS